jgi:hypothetical protein
MIVFTEPVCFLSQEDEDFFNRDKLSWKIDRFLRAEARRIMRERGIDEKSALLEVRDKTALVIEKL